MLIAVAAKSHSDTLISIFQIPRALGKPHPGRSTNAQPRCVMRTQREEVALMLRADAFHKHSEKCQSKAEQETDPLESQLWLLMAKQWSQLARYVADRPDDS